MSAPARPSISHLAWPVLIATALLLCACGCSTNERSGDARGNSAQQSRKAFGPEELQSVLMSASDELVFAVADACAQIIARTDRPEAQRLCHSIRLGTAMSAISAATCPNPRVGYVDLLTLAMLGRMATEEPTALATLEERDRLLLRRTFATQEERLWARGDAALSDRQEDELRDMIIAWRNANPDRVGVTQLRLPDFEGARMEQFVPKADPSDSSLLQMLRLDPMSGIDPAARQLRQARLFAQRMSYWTQHLPVVLGWQVELTAARLFSSDAATGFATSSARISTAVDDVSQSFQRIATSYERTLEELPRERAAALEQADRALKAQVKAMIEQSAAAVAKERQAALEQAGETLSARLQALLADTFRQADAQQARTLAHAAQLVAAERARTLSDTETMVQRLIDRLTNRVLLVIAVAAALIVFCAALLRRRRRSSATYQHVREDSDTPIKGEPVT